MLCNTIYSTFCIRKPRTLEVLGAREGRSAIEGPVTSCCLFVVLAAAFITTVENTYILAFLFVPSLRHLPCPQPAPNPRRQGYARTDEHRTHRKDPAVRESFTGSDVDDVYHDHQHCGIAISGWNRAYSHKLLVQADLVPTLLQISNPTSDPADPSSPKQP